MSGESNGLRYLLSRCCVNMIVWLTHCTMEEDRRAGEGGLMVEESPERSIEDFRWANHSGECLLQPEMYC